MLTGIIASAGIVLAAVGALLLFRYGAPFAVRSDDTYGLSTGQTLSPKDKARQVNGDRLGWAGAALGLLGAVLQLVAVWVRV